MTRTTEQNSLSACVIFVGGGGGGVPIHHFKWVPPQKNGGEPKEKGFVVV